MESVPQELVDHISSFLAYRDLKNTLFVSPKFQLAAELQSHAFSEFTFKDVNDTEAEIFVATYGGRRLRYLEKIQVQTSFPPLTYPKKRRKRDASPEPPLYYKTQLELDAKDKLFTKQIQCVFNALHKAETLAASQHHTRKIELEIWTPVRQIDPEYCPDRQHPPRRIHLLLPETLPQLSTIQRLVVRNPEYRTYDESRYTSEKLDLRILLDLSAKLPNLVYLDCKLGHLEWSSNSYPVKVDYVGCRRDTRRDFAEAFEQAILPDSLRHIHFNFVHQVFGSLEEQRTMPPDLLRGASYDVFSNSLRLLSTRLTTLELYAIADHTLFWPPSEEGSVPYWPNLKHLSVMLHISTLSGHWYFDGPLGEGTGDEQAQNSSHDNYDREYPPLDDTDVDGIDTDDEPWCSADNYDSDGNIVTDSDSHPMFRTVPRKNEIEPLLASFARAAANMPKLRDATLSIPLNWYPWNMQEAYEEWGEDVKSLFPAEQMTWTITYMAPEEEKPSALRQLWWKVGKWRPSDALHGLFQDIGKMECGDALEEYWESEEIGHVQLLDSL